MRKKLTACRPLWTLVLCCALLFSAAAAARPAQQEINESHAFTAVAVLELSQNELAGDTSIHLIGLAEQRDSAEPALSLQLVRGAKGFFGSFWELQLHGDERIVPEPITLFDTRSYNWEGTYHIALGYDSRSGTAVAAVVPEGTDEPLAYEEMTLAATEQRVALWQVAESTTNLMQPATWDLLDEFPRVLPWGVAWSWQQPSWAEHHAFSDRHMHRQHPVLFQIDRGEGAWPGKLVIRLQDEMQKQDVAVYELNSEQFTEVVLPNVAAGTYNVLLEYVHDEYSVQLDNRNVTIGTVDVMWSDWQVQKEDDELHIAGRLHLTRDGDVPLDSVNVAADLVLHRPIHVAESVERPRVVSFRELQNTYTVQYDDMQASIPFSLALPLPSETIEMETLFEVQLHLQSEADLFLPADVTTSAWYAPAPRERSWEGFFHHETVEHTPVADGVDLYTLTGEIDDGPIRMYVVVIDVTNPHISVDTLIPYYPQWNSTQWPRATVSDMAGREDALVAMNASYFEIQTTMTPRGAAIRSGSLLKSALPEWETLIGFTEDGVPYIGEWQWTGGVQRRDGTAFRAASGLNTTQRYPDQLALYAAPPSMTTPGIRSGFNNVVELVVDNITPLPDDEQSTRRILRGVVREVRQQQPGVKLEEGTIVVTGYGESAEYLLATYAEGDAVDIVQSLQGVTAWPPLNDWRQLYSAVPTGVVLLENGTYGTPGIRADRERSPRSAIGVTADQSTMFWVSVDGRSQHSVGLTYRELATYFAQLGAFHAVNLDGGGSATLVIQNKQTGRHQLINDPSDGAQRLLPDGIAIFYNENEAE